MCFIINYINLSMFEVYATILAIAMLGIWGHNIAIIEVPTVGWKCLGFGAMEVKRLVALGLPVFQIEWPKLPL